MTHPYRLLPEQSIVVTQVKVDEYRLWYMCRMLRAQMVALSIEEAVGNDASSNDLWRGPGAWELVATNGEQLNLLFWELLVGFSDQAVNF